MNIFTSIVTAKTSKDPKSALSAFLLLVISITIPSPVEAALPVGPIVSCSPAQNRFNVPKDTVISVTFDTDMNSSTLNSNTFIIQASQTGLHTGTYNYDVGSRTATFNPDSDFTIGEIVIAVLTKGVLTTLGDSLPFPFDWTFTIKSYSGSAIFRVAKEYSVGDGPSAVYSLDLNSDGDIDLSIVNGDTNNFSILRNNGYGMFQLDSGYITGAHPNSIVSADLDVDGDMDLAVTHSNPYTPRDYIINHNHAHLEDLKSIPPEWIDSVKAKLRIAYFHTSHGSQITTGMTRLDAFMGGNGVYVRSEEGDSGTLYFDDHYGPDLSNREGIFDDETRDFLDDPANADVNVIMWSWCQILGHDGDEDPGYCSNMDDLIAEYGPGGTKITSGERTVPVHFVYMTGHVNGQGEEGRTNQINNFIRNHCITNNRILYDFADIESWDPDDNYFLDDYVDDGCSYLVDGERTGNWATEWVEGKVMMDGEDDTLNSEPYGGQWYDCSPYHTHALNGNLKAYCAWYMFARIAGWDGISTTGQSFMSKKAMLTNSNNHSDTVSVFLNNGDGTFQARASYPVGAAPCSVFSTDLDLDGDMDLAVSNRNSGTVSVLLNEGNGIFQPQIEFSSGSYPSSISSCDVDVDGDMDLAITNALSEGTVTVLLNSGDGTFYSDSVYAVGSYPSSVNSADFDADGYADLAVSNDSSNDLSILLSNGDGSLQTAVSYLVGDNPLSVFSSDLDADGDMDLSVANSNSNSVSVLLNNGDGTFQPQIEYMVGDFPRFIVTSDLDDDGDMDLAVANSNSGSISLLLNRSREADLRLSNDSLNYGPVSTGSTDSMMLIIWNEGVDSTLRITDIMSSDPDFVPDNRDISILPGDSTTISIIFSPSNQGSYNDSLIIVSNDPSQPQVLVHLSGEGFVVEQILPIDAGWNLISLYVHPDDMSPESIFDPMSCLEQVKSMTESYDPDLPDFLNTLEFLTDGSGYFVNASCAEDVIIIGQPIDGTAITICLSVGWNLIGYPFDTPSDVQTALASLNSAGCLEQVKSMTESYDPDLPDFLNTLEILEPGNGYFINVSCDICFEYPAPVAAMLKSAEAGSIQSPWSTRMYTQSMVHYGKVTLDGFPINGNAVVGAFVNNECRGQDAVKTASGETYTTLVINGEEVEEVTFKLFLEDKIYTSNTLAVNNPGEISRELSSIEFGTDNNISIFPNPAEEYLTIDYNLNRHSQVNISILDILGKTVYTYQQMNKAGSHSHTIEDVKAKYNMTKGTYILKFSIDEYFTTHKILIQ